MRINTFDMASTSTTWGSKRLVALALTLAGSAMAENVLETIGLTNCGPDSDIRVRTADVSYDHGDKEVWFDLQGTSNRVQNVTAELKVTAYGEEIFAESFDPCDQSTFVEQLCPGKSLAAHREDGSGPLTRYSSLGRFWSFGNSHDP